MNNQSLASRISAFLSISIISCSAFFISSCSSGGGTSSYTVGGSVSSTSGSTTGLVIQLNTANDLSLDSDGTFSFTSSLTNGSSYSVTVLTAPTGQTCRITNGSGTISANVTNVNVECRTNLNPNGYYINNGSATVGDGGSSTLPITDLQAIIYDNRFMASSVSNHLLYDGPLEMFGDELTATVSVYRDGLLIYSGVNFTATVIADTSISGTLKGVQEGASNDLHLNHSMDTSIAAVSRIVRDSAFDPAWASTIADSTDNSEFFLFNDGQAQIGGGASDGNFAGCGIATVPGATPVAVIPIADTNLYRITVQLALCTNTDINTSVNLGGTAGYYTGFATSRNDPDTDDTLVFMVSSASGDYAVAEDFK